MARSRMSRSSDPSLRTWVKASGIKDGPLFRAIDRHGNIRTERLVSRALRRIKNRARGVGL